MVRYLTTNGISDTYARIKAFVLRYRRVNAAFYESIILDPSAECYERRHPGPSTSLRINSSRGPEVLIFLDFGLYRSDSSLRAHHP